MQGNPNFWSLTKKLFFKRPNLETIVWQITWCILQQEHWPKLGHRLIYQTIYLFQMTVFSMLDFIISLKEYYVLDNSSGHLHLPVACPPRLCFSFFHHRVFLPSFLCFSFSPSYLFFFISISFPFVVLE